MNVTACLLSWRRKHHLPEICESLQRFPEVNEIIVWQNESDGTLEGLPDDVRVIHCPTNEFVYGRFLAAQEARNEAVFFQDDDLLVHNLSDLACRFEEMGGGTVVANLAQDKSSRHWSVWQTRNNPWVELGFGSIVPHKLVHILQEWPYDEVLLKRKADKIFTVLNPWKAVRAGENEITRLYHNGRESGRDTNSLWHRQDHKPLNTQVIPLALRWKSELERSKA